MIRSRLGIGGAQFSPRRRPRSVTIRTREPPDMVFTVERSIVGSPAIEWLVRRQWDHIRPTWS